jgi:hypothetical protein
MMIRAWGSAACDFCVKNRDTQANASQRQPVWPLFVSCIDAVHRERHADYLIGLSSEGG